MVDVLGVHRADHRELVHDACQVGEQVADVNARVSVLGEPERAPHHGPDLIGVHSVDHAGKPLAVVTLEARLGVEHVDVARTSRHHELDHRAGLGGKVRRFGLEIILPLRCPFLGVRIRGAEVFRQHRCQRRAAEAGADVPDPLASRPGVPGVIDFRIEHSNLSHSELPQISQMNTDKKRMLWLGRSILIYPCLSVSICG